MTNPAPAPDVPDPVPEGSEPQGPESVVARVVVALVALLAPAVVAGGLGIFSVMILVMAADGGLKDKDAAEAMLNGVMISLGVLACSGAPLGLGVMVRKVRTPMLGVALLMGGGGVLAAIVCAGLYLKAAF